MITLCSSDSVLPRTRLLLVGIRDQAFLSTPDCHRLWTISCHEAFASPDCSLATLAGLSEASSQFCWGPLRIQEGLSDLQAQLQEASAWLTQVRPCWQSQATTYRRSSLDESLLLLLLLVEHSPRMERNHSGCASGCSFTSDCSAGPNPKLSSLCMVTVLL